jgi:hypothetical protein
MLQASHEAIWELVNIISLEQWKLESYDGLDL